MYDMIFKLIHILYIEEFTIITHVHNMYYEMYTIVLLYPTYLYMYLPFMFTPPVSRIVHNNNLLDIVEDKLSLQ